MENFALAAADQRAFGRLFPWGLSGLKDALHPGAPGAGMADPVIKVAVQAVIQASLVGAGVDAAKATARAADICGHTCARELALAILADAGV
ncbi:hypothetical protein CU048_13770 [Beijerinckiaceae bacterium]|nr:hypothetical protein CU048_13770 [Beijerinckiaceae bacterium]